MTNKQPLKLCSVNLGDDIIDRLVKVLRTSGLPAQMSVPKNGESLAEVLERTIPDLILVGASGELDIAQASSVCRKKIPKVPRLLVDTSNNENRNIALQFQYHDLVDIQNESWLIHAISREWERYKNSCMIDSLEIELKTLNESHSQMVASSDKGIAYVCDGFHVTCTKRYAKIFEYDSESDISITPLIDLIAPEYQEEFKKFLKEFNKQDHESSAKFETTCMSAGGKPLPIGFELTKSSYEGEVALQVAASQSAKTNVSANDQLTKDFLKQVDYLISGAKKDKRPGSIICLQTWNFWQIRKKVGLISSNEVLSQYYEFLQKAAGSKFTTARLGSDFFALALPGISSDKAQEVATKLIGSIEDHIFEVNGVSVNCYSRAGIIGFDHKTKTKPIELINLAFEAVTELAETDSKDLVRVYQTPAPVATQKEGGFDPNQTLSSLTQSGGLQLTFQPIVSLREDPNEVYEVIPMITDGNGIDIELDKFAATKVAETGESKLDRWLFGLAMARLVRQLAKSPKTRLLLPLSSYVFADKTFMQWVLEQCAKNKISRQHFIFMWPESTFTERLKQAAVFSQLLLKAKMAFCMSEYDHAIDATKTISVLKPKLIKVEESIAENAHEDQKAGEKLAAILGAAAELECATIIPKVDNAPTLAWLWQSGASFVQGDYIQEPSQNMEFDFNEMGM